MPFKSETFQKNVELHLPDPLKTELVQVCQVYTTLTRASEKLLCIREMMAMLDQGTDPATRKALMEACSESCFGKSLLEKARRLQAGAQNLEQLLVQLNEAHIGGGHLQRQGNVIHATYDRCYCGSVSQSKVPFSATYCGCSCGWYRRLFEGLLNQPVEVELLGSIIQGNENCQFLIHLPENFQY